MESDWHHCQAVLAFSWLFGGVTAVLSPSAAQACFPVMLLLPLLLKATLLHLASGFYHPFHNGFYYNHIMNDNSDEQDKGISGTMGAGRLS